MPETKKNLVYFAYRYHGTIDYCTAAQLRELCRSAGLKIWRIDRRKSMPVAILDYNTSK